jgi:hypothetical protein
LKRVPSLCAVRRLSMPRRSHATLRAMLMALTVLDADQLLCLVAAVETVTAS